MPDRQIAMRRDKKIALVAHDNKKQALVEWAKYNRDLLAHHKVYATGTTVKLLAGLSSTLLGSIATAKASSRSRN